MTSGAYVYIDVSRKQDFIYKENELKSSLFRSFIIKSLTEDLSRDKDLMNFKPQSYTTLNQFLAKWEHRFEFSGGGNSIIYFPNEDDARSFGYKYTIEVLRAFPDLELYVSFVEKTKDIPDKVIMNLLHEKADQLKDQRVNQFRRWSYGIEKIDATGMPIRKLSDEAKKAQQSDEKNVQQTLMAQLKRQSKVGEKVFFTVTNELQNYRKNQNDTDLGKSYIGIINIDGNQMGQIVEQIESFWEMQEFGQWIEKIYFHAVSEALKEIGNSELLVTPVVMAGDDLCLITNAEYALELAYQIVQNIMTFSDLSKQEELEERFRFSLLPSVANKMKSLGIHYLSACAGVAITRITYPFYESVKAAEGLCKQAKEALYKVNEKGKNGTLPSMMDWQIVLGQIDPAERYEKMVKRTGIHEQFHIKPLRITRPNNEEEKDTELKNTITDYSSFYNLLQCLIRGLHSGEISHTVLEKVRRAAYNGPEAYRRLFITDQTGQFEWIMKHVRKHYPDRNLDTYAPILEVEESQGKKITYILHDVLEILPYMREYWQVKSERKGGSEHAAF